MNANIPKLIPMEDLPTAEVQRNVWCLVSAFAALIGKSLWLSLPAGPGAVVAKKMFVVLEYAALLAECAT